MADPTDYGPEYSFSGFQANNPSTPLPGARLDDELANIATAVAALVAAIKGVRRSDGVLPSGIVTRDSLDLTLQLALESDNADLVGGAVADAQAAATATSADRVAVAASAVAAAASAAAAALSAGTVNLSLYLAKANNLAGLGSNDTALANIGAAKSDGSNMTGRLTAQIGNNPGVTDWNGAVDSGWYAGNNAANGPGANLWMVQVLSWGASWVTQIAYPFSQATVSNSAVTPMRRHSYDNGGVRTWQPWEGMSPVPVGTTIWVNGTSALPGFIKENGALLSRASFPALWAYANVSGNLVSEETWAAGFSGAFSTGDLATTFRIPDARGEFIRGWDDSRGVDSGRPIGAHQSDDFKSHTHTSNAATNSGTAVNGASNFSQPVYAAAATIDATGGAETRPRNNAKLACIKY